MGGPPRFFALAVTPAGTALAGTCGRGASRSNGVGPSWTPIDGLGSDVVHDFVVAPDGSILAAGSTGLHRSRDDGRSWRPTGLDGQVLYGIAAGHELLMGTANGVVRSTDGGATWSPTEGLADLTVYRVLTAEDGPALAATEAGGVWAFEQGRWRPVGLEGTTAYALLRLGGGVVLAGTRGAGIHRSVDGGRTWAPVRQGPPDTVVHTLVTGADGTVLAGTGAGVHQSHDGGDTWAPMGAELLNHRIFSLAGGPPTLAGSYDGVWQWSSTEGTWQPVDTGLSPDEAFTVAVAPDGRLVAGTSTGALASTDDGRTWRAVAGLAGSAVHALCWTSTGKALAGTTEGVRAAADAAELVERSWVHEGLQGTWVHSLLEVERGRVLAGTLGQGTFVRSAGQWEASGDAVPNPWTYHLCRTQGRHLLAATGTRLHGEKSGGIFRSTDGGRTWTSTRHTPITVYRIVEDGAGCLFAGAQRCHVLISTDGGASWVTTPPPVDDLKLYCLAIDSDGRLFLGAGALLLCSDDGASSWQVVEDDVLDGVTTYEIAEAPDGALVAATSAGLLRSDDHGRSWAGTGLGP